VTDLKTYTEAAKHKTPPFEEVKSTAVESANHPQPENGRWKGYQQLLLARLKELWREPEVIFWVFVFPILLTLGLGIAFRDKPADLSRVVVVAGPGAAKPYALLRDALDKSGRVGVGTIVLRQREHLASVAPAGEALVLTTMRWAYEIRSTDGLGLPGRTTARDRRELELALRLVDTLAGDWDPRRYKDTYHDVLMEVIARKAAGKEIRAPKVARAPRVRGLMSALEASLRERRPGAKAAGRRHARRAA